MTDIYCENLITNKVRKCPLERARKISDDSCVDSLVGRKVEEGSDDSCVDSLVSSSLDYSILAVLD